MKSEYVLVIVICNYIMRGVCFAGAAWLAYHSKDGWGWLIFAGIVCSLSFGDKDKDRAISFVESAKVIIYKDSLADSEKIADIKIKLNQYEEKKKEE